MLRRINEIFLFTLETDKYLARIKSTMSPRGFWICLYILIPYGKPELKQGNKGVSKQWYMSLSEEEKIRPLNLFNCTDHYCFLLFQLDFGISFFNCYSILTKYSESNFAIPVSYWSKIQTTETTSCLADYVIWYVPLNFIGNAI